MPLAIGASQRLQHARLNPVAKEQGLRQIRECALPRDPRARGRTPWSQVLRKSVLGRLGLPRGTYLRWAEKDPRFVEQLREASEAATERMEEEDA